MIINNTKYFVDRIVVLLMLATVGCTTLEVQEDSPALISPPSSIGTKENAQARWAYEMAMIASPRTGRLPVGIDRFEREFMTRVTSANQSSRTSESAVSWESLGPINVGGRTRALAVDLGDESIFLAGGISGGVWKSTDAGGSWKRTSPVSIINSVTCLAQDPTDGYRQNWYFGTGELRGNSARAEGAPYRGNGIFKSTDNGETWSALPSTQSAGGDLFSEGVFDNPFNYAWNMVINPSLIGEGEIYVAIYGGIVRSVDGGISWQTVLGEDLITSPLDDLNEAQAPYYTNVVKASNGRLYASLSTTTSLAIPYEGAGIYTSSNGVTWVRVVSYTNVDRVVMDVADQNGNLLYIYATRNDGNFLFQYNRQSGQLIELSDNLPDGEGIEALDSQSSYNMVLRVYPDNPNIIFLGGTNLYRSTDGFTSKSNIRHIGGYHPDGSFEAYDGHHPDQHALVFLPSDSKKLLSGSDGGVRFSSNALADSVIWTTKNNGYVTSQFYAAALSKDRGDFRVVGGMQDNGSYFKPGKNIGVSNWTRLIGGDGAYCATTPDSRYWYISFQEANIFRISVNSNNKISAFAQVNPVGGSDYLFINPFVLDPNNYNRMYLAGGRVLWRNDNLLQIPSGVQEPTAYNWFKMTYTTGEEQITALDVSLTPANIVYFGNRAGELYKVEDAHEVNGKLTKLASLDSGYVSSVSIDPLNADHIMFTYSNYNIQSVFVSKDGGATIEAVGGNLEENTDGSGYGPSVRCSKIIPLVDGKYEYFVGTSSGLFRAKTLDGHATKWSQTGEITIGRSVVRSLDYRPSDGFLLAATHGNGVYIGKVEDTNPYTPPSYNEGYYVDKVFPNPFSDQVTLSIRIPRDGDISIRIVDLMGRTVKHILMEKQFAGNLTAQWRGEQINGSTANPGTYCYQVLYEGKVKSGKIVFLGRQSAS